MEAKRPRPLGSHLISSNGENTDILFVHFGRQEGRRRRTSVGTATVPGGTLRDMQILPTPDFTTNVREKRFPFAADYRQMEGSSG